MTENRNARGLWEQRMEHRPARAVARIGIYLMLIGALLMLVGLGIRIITAPIAAVTGVVERTLNPDNAIANYEWFQRQVHDIAAIDVRLGAARTALSGLESSAGARTGWTFEDRGEWNRLNSVVLGLEGQRAAMVAEYNARTQMENRDLFRTSDLPEVLQ